MFYKRKDCGCIISAIYCGTKDKLYLLGAHQHSFICDVCKQEEEAGNDTLYEMWMTDNVTNEFEYMGWRNTCS